MKQANWSNESSAVARKVKADNRQNMDLYSVKPCVWYQNSGHERYMLLKPKELRQQDGIPVSAGLWVTTNLAFVANALV